MYYVSTLSESYVKDDDVNMSTIAYLAEHSSLVIFLKDHSCYDSYVVNFKEIGDKYFIQPYEVEHIVNDLYRTMLTLGKQSHFLLNIGKNVFSLPISSIASLEFVDTLRITEIAGNYRKID